MGRKRKAMEKTMEIITAQEALHRLAGRYNEKILNNERKNMIGLDINDYASVFRHGSEVTFWNTTRM